MIRIDRVSADPTPELVTVLLSQTPRRHECLSATVEVLPREHPTLHAEVQALRTGKEGRDPAKIRALAETSPRKWEWAKARGQGVLREGVDLPRPCLRPRAGSLRSLHDPCS